MKDGNIEYAEYFYDALIKRVSCEEVRIANIYLTDV